MRRKKLLLINTVDKRSANDDFFVPTNGLPGFQPIALGIIAALTPEEWEVELIDENFEDFVDTDADLVGISAYTTSINRATDISHQLQEKGIKTVVGGKHVWLYASEIRGDFDVVVKGEVESVWPQLIADFENNALKGFYEGDFISLSDYTRPRRDIFEKYNYEIATVQFSRGCVNNCHFCAVPVLYKHTYRQRNIDDAIEELKETPQKYVFLVDDTIYCDAKSNENIKQFFYKIAESNINKRFICAASIDVYEDDEFLNAAKKAGVRVLYIGFESENVDDLKNVNKRMNYKSSASKYTEAVKKIHAYKMAIMGGFISGFENDTPEKIKERGKYILNSSIDASTLTILTPLAETPLFERLKRENRLLHTEFPKDWIYYNASNYTTDYKQDRQKIMEAFYGSSLASVDCKTITKKFFFTILRSRSFVTAKTLLMLVKNFHVGTQQCWLVRKIIKQK
ncbi:MAG: B12-binding domain-containing radical SAM protein [Bacteroidota bacterium]